MVEWRTTVGSICSSEIHWYFIICSRLLVTLLIYDMESFSRLVGRLSFPSLLRINSPIAGYLRFLSRRLGPNAFRVYCSQTCRSNWRLWLFEFLLVCLRSRCNIILARRRYIFVFFIDLRHIIFTYLILLLCLIWLWFHWLLIRPPHLGRTWGSWWLYYWPCSPHRCKQGVVERWSVQHDKGLGLAAICQGRYWWGECLAFIMRRKSHHNCSVINAVQVGLWQLGIRFGRMLRISIRISVRAWATDLRNMQCRFTSICLI